MSAATDRIKALLASRQANQTATPAEGPIAISVEPPQPTPTVQPVEVAAESKVVIPDPLAGLSGTALILAKLKLSKSGGLPTTGSGLGVHSGQVTGTSASVATETTAHKAVAQTSAEIAQRVLTPAERQLDMAREMLQKKQDEGFYDIKEPSKLPVDLPANVVSDKLRELDAALIMRTPRLPNLMIDINRNLRQYDELAYLLTDDQLGLIVASNLAVKDVQLLTTKPKGKAASTTAAKLARSVTVDDL